MLTICLPTLNLHKLYCCLHWPFYFFLKTGDLAGILPSPLKSWLYVRKFFKYCKSRRPFRNIFAFNTNVVQGSDSLVIQSFFICKFIN